MTLTVKRIHRSEYAPWILQRHYAHRMPPVSHAYGAYVGKVMMGVCTFGMPASRNLCIGVCGEDYADKVLELNRLCVDDNAPFPTSMFLGRCLSRLTHLFTNGQCIPDGRIIVSYADTDQGHIGKIYQATNWKYTGCTKERTDIHPGEGKHSRHYDKDGDYSNRQKRSAKHRYVFFVGDRRWRKRAELRLNYQIEPYPQGDTKRYDATCKIQTQDLLF